MASPKLSLLQVIILTLFAGIGCGRAEMITSEESERAVDALYTAVTARRTDLVQQSEKNLQQLKADGKMSEALHEELTEIIAESRTDWISAAQQLDALMRSQTE